MLSSLVLAALSSQAQAYVYIGNPPLKLKVVRAEGDLISGDAVLEGVRVYYCGGGYDDYEANVSIDPTQVWTTTITGGDLCSISARWDSDVTVGSSAFEVRYEGLVTSITLTGATVDTTQWSSVQVDSGTFTGSLPQLAVQIGT